jgi:hypothetical protein
VPGASVPDNTEWNNTVLGQDGRYLSLPPESMVILETS